MARPGLPRAYFDEVIRQLDRLPEGLTGGPVEPTTLRMSRVGRAHRRAARYCFRALAELDLSPTDHAWWVEVEPDVRLPGDLLGVPDLAGWRLERAAPHLDASSIPLTPDWCCKVITSDTARNYRAVRLPFYARAGIRWFWLIDPMARSVEVLESVNGELVSRAIARNQDQPVLAPFNCEIDLASWWLS